MNDREHDGFDEEDRGPLSDLDFDSDEESAVLEPGLGVRDESGQDATPLVASRAGTLNIDTSTGISDFQNRSRRPSDSSKKVVAWGDLPKKKQLVVITLARLSEPLVQTSLQVRMPSNCLIRRPAA